MEHPLQSAAQPWLAGAIAVAGYTCVSWLPGESRDAALFAGCDPALGVISSTVKIISGHHSAPAHTGSALPAPLARPRVRARRGGARPARESTRVGRPVDRFVLTGWQVGLAGPAGMPVPSVATTGTHISTPVAS